MQPKFLESLIPAHAPPGAAPAAEGARDGLRRQARGLSFEEGARLLSPRTEPPAGDRPMLRSGSTGPAVVDLQTRLTARGDPLEPDGIFGPLTRGAVVRFQQAQGLDPDGIVGPLTWGALDAAGPAPGQPATGQAAAGALAGGALGGTVPVDDATREAIVAGLKDQGDYVPDERAATPEPAKAIGSSLVGDSPEWDVQGGEFHFKNPALDIALEMLLARYSLTGGRVMGGEMAAADPGRQAAFNVEGAETSKARGYVRSHPAWVKAFQSILAGTPTAQFDTGACTAMGLLVAFLQEWTRRQAGTSQTHSTIETFLGGVGGSESNDVADPLGAPPTHSYNWCAASSNRAAVLGLLKHGLRFDIASARATAGDPRPDFAKEVEAQAGYFASRWASDTGNMLYDRQAFLAPLEPGDRITIVDQRSNHEGHVVTVVAPLAAGAEGPFQYISGNTRKAVRVEESIRKAPPPNYTYQSALTRTEPSFSARPPGPGEAWTTVVTRSGKLDAHALLQEMAAGPYSTALAELKVVPLAGNLRDLYANVPPWA